MVSLIKNFPAEGWVKAGSIVDEKNIKEISRLQNENKSLRDQLDTVKIQVLAGTEKLQQGEDVFLVDFRLNNWVADKRELFSKQFTWNELYGVIAPHLLGECSEYDMETALEEFIAKKCVQKMQNLIITVILAKKVLDKLRFNLRLLG
jgi:hypothetical protein